MVNQHERLDKRYWQLARNAGIASYLDAALLVSTGIALASWQEHYQLNAWWTGALSTILTLCVGAGSFFGGRLSDRFGRVLVFNIDILGVVVGATIIALAPSMPVLVVGLVVAGLASGADLPTSLAVISERVPERYQGRVVSSTEIFWIAGIVISQGIGFLVSPLAMTGIRLLFVVIAVVALLTWLVRVASPSFKRIEDDLAAECAATQSDAHEQTSRAYPLGKLLTTPRYLLPLIGLSCFYLFWNIPANTWGSFLNYYMVTVGGRTQSFATACAFFANILGVLVLYGIYIRFADGKHRYTMMHIGLILCIASFVLSALAGSASWQVFTVCYFVYCAANMLHGEPLYKVWSQELFPVNARATATGFTYAAVRFITAAFSLATPAIMAASPTTLLWLLVGSLCLSYIAAMLIIRFIGRHHVADPAIKSRS